MTDIFTVNKFARSTFRALVGVDTYVTENGPTLVDNYISSTRFLNGSYTPSSKQEVSGCVPIVVVLPFQANSLKNEVKVFMALDLPPNFQNVKLRPFVNDTKMDEVPLNLNEDTSSRVITTVFG